MFRLGLSYFLSRALGQAMAEWSQYREALSRLEWWFRQGIITEQDVPERVGWPAVQLHAAVLSRMDGIVFSKRELFGLREYETTDAYWSLNPPPPVPQPHPGEDRDGEYHARYAHMARIDIFHLRGHAAELAGGVPTLLEPALDALRACLRSPRVMRIAAGGNPGRCEFALAAGRRVGKCPLLAVEIKYRDAAP